MRTRRPSGVPAAGSAACVNASQRCGTSWHCTIVSMTVPQHPVDAAALQTPPLLCSEPFFVRGLARPDAVLPTVWILCLTHAHQLVVASGLTLLEKPDIAVGSLTALRSLRHSVLHSRTRLVLLSFTKGERCTLRVFAFSSSKRRCTLNKSAL